MNKNTADSYKMEFQPVGLRGRCKPGISILECARNLDVDLVNLCGGSGTCGQCIVQVLEGSVTLLSQKTQEEILSKNLLKQGWCLACKTMPLSDLKINIPPESLTSPQRTQVESTDVPLIPEPLVKLFKAEMLPPGTDDLCSDSRRLIKSLKKQYNIENPVFDFEVLRRLPVYLRNNKYKANIVLRKNEIIALTGYNNLKPLGIAFDIGTTKIAGYLVDLDTGATLESKGMMNPQIKYGEDIIARMVYAQESPGNARQMRTTLSNTLNRMIEELCSKKGVLPENIFEIAIVCNTAVHHLFLELPTKNLSMAPYIPVIDSSLNIKARNIGIEAAKGAYIHLLPNIAGYVGADHVAMLLALDIFKQKGVIIALDIGTNTEICLSNKGCLTSLSCASGPAFEGAHIKFGMRAAKGAIERFRIENNEITYKTIGNKLPKGFCGSGILDVFAQLYKAGIMDRTGKLLDKHPLVRTKDKCKEFVIPEKTMNKAGCPEITFSQKDIREIQLAKGAIRTGIQSLLRHNNLEEKDIDKIYIAGAFGFYINVESAKIAGMLPDIPSERFTQIGNAAGLGSRLALISSGKRKQAVQIAKKTKYLELATFPDFPEIFTKSMYLGA